MWLCFCFVTCGYHPVNRPWLLVILHHPMSRSIINHSKPQTWGWFIALGLPHSVGNNENLNVSLFEVLDFDEKVSTLLLFRKCTTHSETMHIQTLCSLLVDSCLWPLNTGCSRSILHPNNAAKGNLSSSLSTI